MIRERNTPCPFDVSNTARPTPSSTPLPPPIEIVGFEDGEYYEGRNIELINLEENEYYEKNTNKNNIKIQSVVYDVLSSKDRKKLITEINKERSKKFRTRFLILPKLNNEKTIFRATLLDEKDKVFKEIFYNSEIVLKKETQQTSQTPPPPPPPADPPPQQQTQTYNPTVRGLLDGQPKIYTAGSDITLFNFEPGTNKVIYTYTIGDSYTKLKTSTDSSRSFRVSFTDIPRTLNQRDGSLNVAMFNISKQTSNVINIDRVRVLFSNQDY